MQNVIVGTAGHVDHGKTCLIKALTGTDTDRLKEEQKRGITIELGFANLPNDEGLRIGIIDVPGHEKFVKNMLAGIGGIDLVLMVIALDEGVMPQTVEHFEILKMLHIKQGIIVFTKADLVDEDWAKLVEEDVTDLVKGSFLEHAERIQVSAYTGKNINELRQMIFDKIRAVGKRREEKELFRLPIDRIFTMDGFGTVVTGTLLEGCCQVGQEVMVYPQERLVKIRGIQNHGQKEDEAGAGQRTAINLVNIKKEELDRGEILATPGFLVNSLFIDGKIQLFKSTKRQLKNGDRVHLSYGSAQSICKVVLLDKEVIEAGEEAYAQLRFDSPVAVKKGDRFILRFYSPVETFGGGIVLDAEAPKHRHGHEEVIDALCIKEMGTEEEVLEQVLKEESRKFPSIRDLSSRLNRTSAETEEWLEKFRHKKKVLSFNDGSFIHKDYWEEIASYVTTVLGEFHVKNPISAGMEKEEFKSRLSEHFYLKDMKKADVLFNELLKRSIVTTVGSTVAAVGFEASYSDELSGMKDEIEKRYLEGGVEMPSMDEAMDGFKDRDRAKQVILDLAKKEVIVKIAPGFYMYKDSLNQALNLLRTQIAVNSNISLGQYRDLLGTSRKYAVMLLEYCDQQKITKKQDDVRVLLK
ncbi:MAG: selenocysteine-specific translation elongation factor [Clostridium sp.]